MGAGPDNKVVSSLKHKIRKFEILEDFQLLLAGESDPVKVIGLVAEATVRLIDAETVAFPMLSTDNLQVAYDFAYGLHKDAFLKLVMPIEDSGLCGWVLENRRPILSSNLSEDPRVKKELAKSLGINTAVLAPLVARGRIIGGLSAFNRKDGSPFTEEDLDILLRLANYAALAINNAYLMDELRREQLKLKVILDGVKDGIVFLSKDGGIISVNRAMGNYFPMKPEEMVGANVKDFTPIKPLADVFDWYAKARPGSRCRELLNCGQEDCPVYSKDYLRCWSFSEGHCNKAEHNRRGDEKIWDLCAHCDVVADASERLAEPRETSLMGRTLQATSTLAILDRMKGIFGEVMVFHDVTAEKGMENQRSEFISMMTHDLKAPLTSIIGYSELISVEEDTAKIREMNQSLKNNSDHLLRMINSFLDLNRVEAGKVALNISPLSMEEFLPTVFQTFAAQATEKQVNLSWHVDKGTPKVLADVDQIYRIVGNLISNSLRHVSEKGNIKVSASKWKGEFVRITVEDDGSGINPEDLPMIFEKYYTTSKMKGYKGSGLGLAIVKLLTEAHGGSVSAESEKGKGARFIVSLPAVKGA